MILWLGDLNYRLEELDVAKVKQLIDEKAFLELCQYDQVPMSLLPEVVLRVLLHHTPCLPSAEHLPLAHRGIVLELI